MIMATNLGKVFIHCVQVEEHQAVDIDVYHCPNCHVLHGPSLMKKRKNWHRHDYTEPDDRTRPVQAGTSVFVRELQARSFPSADEILVRMQGHQVTPKYLEKHSFLSPIMVPQLDGLGLKLPPPSFSIEDVEHYVGGDKIIDVIDVARQADSKIKLSEFVKYYYNPNRPKVLNVISLEFSDTKMAELVEVPDVARKMSWVENYWPDDSFFPKPFVQKYCLMGVEGSYTDFHIDFGGTSVWYHVLWGEKIFYLIKPTPGNLALYEAWSSSPNQSEMFFGDKVDKCYKCIVRQGTTLLIPTGWIHAVLTSQDCMAFGGNFLHNLNIGMQLRCYEMERRLKTPDLFKFPYFEAICWYVAKNLLETLKELREDNFQPPVYLMEGVKALTCALKSWLKREATEPTSEVPDHIKPNNLIKELTKEIRHQEKEQLSGGGSCKPMKSQGSGGVWSVTRSTAERGTRVHRMARRLRDHGASRTPSNLDILELHTREVLRRLEVAPFHEDTTLCSRVNGKFKKTSASSTATAGRGLDNDLRLVLCNGRIVRDERQWTALKGPAGQKKDGAQLKTEVGESAPEPHSSAENKGELNPLRVFMESVKSELRKEASRHSDLLDSVSESSCTTQRKDSSEEYSGSSGEEGDSVQSSRKDLYRDSWRHRHRNKRPERKRPPSPNTEEAIQGMLSMAGLLYPEVSSSQELWWSSPAYRSLDGDRADPVSGEESPEDSDNDSALSHQDELRPLKHLNKNCRARLSQQIQENKNFMDSQGNSSEAWSDNPQNTEISLLPPFHPSKRPASNPPPISNQATKGKRPKKGMATAKQRLGKILRINSHGRFFV
ncbi:lysine-specific demethylase 7B-like isoform X2 [Scleropages formosus]|uniref:lysine-specific demethylase 7B-like isoform X2 n=1 Tax=Scleropages formosus TaxID=113540 RepID=UPI000877F4C2|nr:lysine-specific demethylase 7B-like isoform X2 [Scleropages formosus]